MGNQISGDIINSKHDKFSTQEQQDLEKAFRKYDQDKDGCLTFGEVRKMLKYLNLEISMTDAQFLFRLADKNGAGHVGLEGLIDMFKEKQLIPSRKDLRNDFKDMDVNYDGYLTFDELKNGLGVVHQP